MRTKTGTEVRRRIKSLRSVGPGAAALCLALALSPAALAAPDDAQTLRCTPLWPVFCGNVHVLCSGRSKIGTDPFTVSFSEDAATVTPDAGPPVAMTIETGSAGRVLHPAEGRDWIRLHPDGRFSHRIYLPAGALMSTGTCRPVDGT